jgi:hypothetical protein
MKVGLSDAGWQRLTDEAMRLLGCWRCMDAASGAVLQPFWVGEAYEPGGVVLVGRNPAGKQLPEPAEQLLARLRDQSSPAALLEWSRWRIAHMISTPWTQWRRAFTKVVAGC